MQAASPAPRFTLALPMRYRIVGQPKWRSAKTANVSASGLIFVAAEKLPLGAKLEVEISMSADKLKPTHLTAVSEVLRQGNGEEPLMTTLRHVTSHTVEGDFVE